ncbi:MAG TPA: PaaI family thioesterase [Candidatus Udaeobacter sp.]|nr:PaaI family thioesterase [Candidatus Udaeobacter sp.]
MKAAPGLTGLELMRALIEGRLPPPPIALTLGFRLAEVGEGRAVFVGEPGEHLYNPIGSVHGGWAMTLLDSAMGCSVHTTLAAGERYTSLEVKVNFVRPITADTGTVRCEASVVHRGGTIATAEGRLIAEATGKLLAHGTTTCIIARA